MKSIIWRKILECFHQKPSFLLDILDDSFLKVNYSFKHDLKKKKKSLQRPVPSYNVALNKSLKIILYFTWIGPHSFVLVNKKHHLSIN